MTPFSSSLDGSAVESAARIDFFLALLKPLTSHCREGSVALGISVTPQAMLLIQGDIGAQELKQELIRLDA